jgi:D-amino-acid dehydrogenase
MGAALGHVVVVGAGIVGLASAQALVRDGWRVSVVDAGGPERDGASFGNAGLVVPSHVVPLAQPGAIGRSLRWLLDAESPFYVAPRLDPALVHWAWCFWRASTAERVRRAVPLLHALHEAGLQAHVDLAGRLGAPPLERRGLMMLCATDAGLIDARHEAAVARAAGVRAFERTATEVAAAYPGVDVRVRGGVWYEADAHRSPRSLMQALEAWLGPHVTFRWRERAVGWHVGTGATVRALVLGNGERLAADAFVLAGGHATPPLAHALHVRVPIQPGRGYSVTVAQPPQRPEVPAILVEARVAMTPLAEGIRWGGTMEVAPAGRPVDPRRVRGIAKAVERTFPAFEAAALQRLPVWSGARPVSPDGLPFLGRLRRTPNVVLAAGHGMLGFSLGPVTGNLVADLLGERPLPFAIGALAPERFAHHGDGSRVESAGRP